MEQLIEYLPFIIPLVIAEYALAIAALIHVLKHPHYRFGNKIMWIIVVLVVQIVGPVVYFAFGQNPDRSDD